MSRRIKVTFSMEVEAKDRVSAAVIVMELLARGTGTVVTEEPEGHVLDGRGRVAIRVWPEGEWDGRDSGPAGELA